MAIDPHAEAALALHRFGMGPRAGSIAAIASDPRGALLAELERPGAGHVAEAGFMTSAQASRAVFEFRGKSARRRPRLPPKGANASPIRQRMDDARPPAECRRRRARRPKQRRPRTAADFPRRKPKRGSTPRSTPSSALSSGWSGSGRTISAFRPTRSCVDGGRLRARSDPAACARPLRRHAAGGRRPSGDAVLSRQQRLDRPRVGGRHQPQPRAQRESRARDSRTAYARRRTVATRQDDVTSSPMC